MNVREWALIIFTILAQMSVGSFIVLGVVHFFAMRKAGDKQADELSDRALIAIGSALILGLAASLMHLGNPINAYKAVTNFASSWLSREILFGVLFAVVGGVFALMQWRKMSSFAVRNGVGLVAAVIGIVLVYSMSQVYAIPTRPSWNTPWTLASFYITTLLLGVVAMGAAFVANYAYLRRRQTDDDQQRTLLRDSLKWLALASILLLGLEYVVLPINLATWAGGAAAGSAAVLVSQYSVALVAQLVLVFLGAGVLGMFVYRIAQTPGREGVLGVLAYSAFVMVLIAEVVGRFLFYATSVRFGLQ